MDRSIEAVSSPTRFAIRSFTIATTGFVDRLQAGSKASLRPWRQATAEQSTRSGAAHVTAATPDNTGLSGRAVICTLTILKWFRPPAIYREAAPA